MDEKLKKLQADRAALAKAMRELGANQASWTPEDRASFDKLDTDHGTAVTACAARKTELEAEEAERKRIADRLTVVDSVQDYSPPERPKMGRDGGRLERRDSQGRITGSIEGTDEHIELIFDEDKGERRHSYKDAKKQNARLLQSSGYKPWGEFNSARDFIRAGLDGHHHAAFRDRVSKHYNAVTGMGEGVGADGGYLVMPEMASKIIDRVYQNDLWSRTDNYTVKGNSMTFVANAETSRAHGSRHGGLRGYWLGEGATKTASKPTLREINLKLAKLAVVVYLTDELLEDTGTVLSDYVTKKAAEEFNFLIGDALINGTGVGQPLGVLNWPSLVVVSKEPGQLADTLETENIIKMFSRFYAPNRYGMVWNYNQDVEPELLTMTLGVGTGGVVTYMPPGGLSSAPYATLMGRPSMPTEFNPTLGDQGDILAWDPRQMLSISKGGIAQAVSIHVQFLTDQTALRFVMRLNAGPWESAAMTPFKGTLTQSSAVALEAR